MIFKSDYQIGDIDWRELPPLTTLKAFEATARLGGYSAAARSLNVTPAAIAQQVRKLETDVGATLVRREGRGLVLTAAGRQLARPLHEAFAVLAQGVRDLKHSEAGRGVRVSTTDYFSNAVILPNLGDLWRRHPGLQTSFSPDGNTAPLDFERFDIAIRGGPPGDVWEGCDATWLLDTPIILCAAPGLLGEGHTDLSALPWILDRGMGGGAFELAVRAAGCDPEKVEIVDPGSARMEQEAALLGYGLHVTPALTVSAYLDAGQLVRVDQGLDMSATYCALTRPGFRPEKTQAFLDWLVEICAPQSVDDKKAAETDPWQSP